jgi:kynurenine formamidase
MQRPGSPTALARAALGVALVALALAAAAPAAAQEETALGPAVDLTHAFDAATIVWPTEEGFVLERGPAGRDASGAWYAANRLRLPEHGGTHVDAPIHFHEGGSGVDGIPLARLVAPAVVVDVREACAADRDHAIGRADLARFEAHHGRIPEGAALLLHTGFGATWPDRARYLGTDARGAEAVAALHFPGLAPDAARWLVRERRVAAVGIDTASIDPGVSTRFESHRVLSAAEIPAFENLANLDRLPATGAVLVALPMRIAGGTGAPLRAVAFLPRRR